MTKYNREFIETLVGEKNHMTIPEIAVKHNLTKRQARYVIYNLGRKEENMSLVEIYRRLRKISEEIRVKNKIVARLIKLLS
jgi:uncharacterized Fe-S cluster-containing radical SAM superfamily enzyme